MTLARQIIGMANRRVDQAAAIWAIFVLESHNTWAPDGPRWTARYETADGPPLLIVMVESRKMTSEYD